MACCGHCGRLMFHVCHLPTDSNEIQQSDRVFLITVIITVDSPGRFCHSSGSELYVMDGVLTCFSNFSGTNLKARQKNPLHGSSKGICTKYSKRMFGLEHRV